MGPYLLLGFFIAGLLHAFVSREVYSRYLSTNDFKSVLLASLAGVPLPLCSCGVIPTATSMRANGASRSATVSFLITTPQTGVDSIAATYSLMGVGFAIVRPVAAFVTGIFGGLYTGWFVKSKKIEEAPVEASADTCSDGCCGGGCSDSCCSGGCCSDSHSVSSGFFSKCVEALRYGFYDMVQDIGKNLLIGLLVGAAIGILVPDDFFSLYANVPIVNMLLVLLVAIPMYVCATGSIPIAAALMFKGLSPGAALVFLMAGPAVNMASVMVIGKVLGRKTMAAYIGSVVIGALIFGVLIDYALPSGWFVLPKEETMHFCHQDTIIPLWQQICAWVLLAMLAVGLGARYFRKPVNTIKKDKTMSLTFKVKGMTCNHCKANVENAVSSVEGAEKVTVDLGSGIVTVEGDASAEAIIKAVESRGYECTLEK